MSASAALAVGTETCKRQMGQMDIGGKQCPEGAAGRHPSLHYHPPWHHLDQRLVLEGAARFSPLPTGLFLNKRALSLPAGARPHDAEQDKGSIYPVKELGTRKGPEAAKAHSPCLRHFGFWCSGLVSCRHK